MSQSKSAYLSNMIGKVQKSVGVSILIIVPGDKFNELGAHLNTGVIIEC